MTTLVWQVHPSNDHAIWWSHFFWGDGHITLIDIRLQLLALFESACDSVPIKIRQRRIILWIMRVLAVAQRRHWFSRTVSLVLFGTVTAATCRDSCSPFDKGVKTARRLNSRIAFGGPCHLPWPSRGLA